MKINKGTLVEQEVEQMVDIVKMPKRLLDKDMLLGKLKFDRIDNEIKAYLLVEDLQDETRGVLIGADDEPITMAEKLAISRLFTPTQLLELATFLATYAGHCMRKGEYDEAD